MNQPLPHPASAQNTAPLDEKPAAACHWFTAVLPVVLIAACAELGISLLNNSALPIYFTRGMHLSTHVYGQIMAMFFVSEVLFKSPLGALADKIGRKPLMLGGAMVTIFTPILLIKMHFSPISAAGAFVIVGCGLLRALDGVGEAALWPSLYAYVGDVVAEAKRGAAMGILNFVYMVGIAVSFLAGGFVDDTFGPVLAHQETWGHQVHVAFRRAGSNISQSLHHLRRLHPLHLHSIAHAPSVAAAPVPVSPIYQPQYYYPSFYLASVLFAIAAIAALFLRSKVRTKPGDHGHVPDEAITWKGFMAAVRTAPQFLLLAFVVFGGIGCISLLVKKFALDEFHVTETQFGQLVLGPALLIGLFAVPAGRLADRWGKARTIHLGFILAAVGLWGIPILHHILRHNLVAGQAAFVCAAVVMGIGSVLAFPAWLAMLTSLCEDHQRGRVFGAVSTAQGVGALFGALFGTALYDYRHIAPFVAASILVTLGAILALIFVRDQYAKPPCP